MAKGISAINDIYLQAIGLGLKCSRSNFYGLIRNPVYAGVIKITSSGNSASRLIPGQHLGIISFCLFERVQKLINPNNSHIDKIRSSKTIYPFKSFISCPKCSKVLTASSSTGRSAKYHYYHCNSVCGFRIRAEHVSSKFAERLRHLAPLDIYVKLYRDGLCEAFRKEGKKILLDHTRVLKGIERFSELILKTKSLLLEGYIDFENYRLMKADLEAKIELLGKTISSNQVSGSGVTQKINKGLIGFQNLYQLFFSLSPKLQREFLELILVKCWQCNDSNLDGIFKRSVQIV